MKILLAAVGALLLGIFLGGLGPRAELRQARRALEAAQAEAEAARDRGPSAALPLALGGLLSGGGSDRSAPPRFEPPAPEPPPAPERPTGEAQARADEDAAQRRVQLTEGFDKLKTAADLRAAQHRAAFVERAGLSPEKERALEEIVGRMNRALAVDLEKAAAALAAKPGRLTPRDLADVGAKVLVAYQKADDELAGALDDRARAAKDETRFDLYTQVDVDALRPMAEVIERFEREGRAR